MKLFTQLRRIRNLALMLGLAVLFMADIEANATAKKETPLVNLAEGKLNITSNVDQGTAGSGITNKNLLTDGDKYNLKHNATTNKLNNGNGDWENYVEQGGGATVNGNWVWIQVDLGQVYDIEVINLKRQIYSSAPSMGKNVRGDGLTTRPLNGTKINYQNTTVVISENADMSNGYVVFHQGGHSTPISGVTYPAPHSNYSSGMQDPMGGHWFYMDYAKDKGMGQTPLGTTKRARYVRVYTQNPSGSNVNFMELGVYGYKTSDKIQTPYAEMQKRKINNENPLMIATAYSDDVFNISADTDPSLQGYNTVSGRCKVIPSELKANTTMLLHTNNLRQFSPEHIGQAVIQGFFEAGLQQCWETDTSAMILGNSASASPGGVGWYPLVFLDYGWLDLMYRMYPNLEGTLSTESYWSGGDAAVENNSVIQLEMAHRYGGYFIWADQDHNGYVERMFVRSNWKAALEKYGQNCFMIYKNTGGGTDDLESTSYHQGHWLAGYIGGWGMLSDTWFWPKVQGGQGPLYKSGAGYNDWQKICGVPEALMGSQMISTYLEGGVIYTFEFPEVVYGANNTNSPMFTHVIQDLFLHFMNNPAPSRKEILEDTKVIVYGSLGSQDIWSKTAGTQRGANLYETGRYGNIPVILPLYDYATTAQKLVDVVSKEGLTTAPALMQKTDANLSSPSTRQFYFQGLYPKKYEGTAFADYLEETWYVYNSVINTFTKQTVELPLNKANIEGAKVTAEIEPHTFFMLTEGSDGSSINLKLNNYRINKDKTIFDAGFAQTHNLVWTGNFAPGQPVIEGKKSVYNYMKDLNVVNAGPGQLSPDDNDLRTTTFTISKLTKQPQIELVKGQAADTDGKVQYQDPQVSFNPDTGVATITITCNGGVEYTISDLSFEADTALDLNDPAFSTSRSNLAYQKAPTVSAATSGGGRANHATDGNKANKDNYSDPGANGGGAQWLQVDLQADYKIDEIKLYRYWDGTRQYHNTIVLVSSDANFAPDKTLVLWNANNKTAGKNGQTVNSWPGAGYGTSGSTHTMPEGTDSLYTETQDGKSFYVYDSQVKWLDGQNREKPGKGEFFTGRYVRVYMNGTAGGTTNHVVELEVYGEALPPMITDNTPPTIPSNLKADIVGTTEATISFTPSSDNVGLSHYEVTYTKTGGSPQTTKVNQSMLTLSGLDKNSQYEISIVAIDTKNNRSGSSQPLTIDTTEINVTADVASGRYDSSKQVSLSASHTAEIYYTVDGTKPFGTDGNPSNTAQQYTGTPIDISQSTVLQAAVKKNNFVHPTSAYFYQIGTQSQMDLEAPAAPTQVAVANPSAAGATVSWSSSASDVKAFYIYVDGVKKAEVNTTQATMETTLSDLSPLTAYQVWVTAVDGAGNESLRSRTAEFVTRSQ